MKLLISGGHLTPALALIDFIQATHPETEIIFAGRLYSRQSDHQPSPERQEITKRGISFVPFSSGKLSGGSIFNKIPQFIKLAISSGIAFILIGRYQPTALVSFGGYLAVPLAVAAWLWRVPIITHEQTRTIGVANKLILPLVNKIALSYPETSNGLPEEKVVITGNPIRPAVLKAAEKPAWLSTKSTKPILYITGGSQGSEVINTTISRMADFLLKDWVLIHQCGFASKSRNYERELQQIKLKLSKQKQDRYYIRPWIEEQELGWIYDNCTAGITRAGANTLLEITLKQVPSVIIPLPFSHKDEQLLNAKALAEQGAAVLLLQKDLSPDTLRAALMQTTEKQRVMKRNLKQIADRHTQAADALFAELKELHK